MSLHYTPYIIPLFLAGAISLVLAIFVWPSRRIPGGYWILVLAFAVADWSFGNVLEIESSSLAAKLLWANVEYIGIVSAPLVWFLFVLEYVGRSGWLTRRRVLFLVGIPLITLLLVWTNDWHGLIRQNVELDASGPFPVVFKIYGPWFWIQAVFSYALLLSSTYLLGQKLKSGAGLLKSQVAALIVSALAPWIGNWVYLSGLNPIPHLDWTPVAFALSGVAVAWALFRFHLLDIVPVARDAVVDSMPDGVIVLDTQARVVDINAAALRWIGKTSGQVIGQPAATVFAARSDLVDRYRDLSEFQEEITDGQGHDRRVFNVDISPLHTQGKLAGRLVTLHDITERKRAHEALQESEAYARNVIDSSLDMIITTDTERRIVEFNRAAQDAFGYRREEMLGKHIDVLYANPERGMETRRSVENGDQFVGEVVNRRRSGETFTCLLSASTLKSANGNIMGVVGVSRDITERKRLEEQLRYDTLHDTLTGLPNRSLLLDRLTLAIRQQSRQSAHRAALLFLDLDRFKVVNDSLGHAFGDQFLVAIARRLESCLRPTDTLARLGGDEFAIVINGIAATEDVMRIAERVQRELSRPFPLGQHSASTSASIGIALSATEYDLAENILRDADAAMYRAKASGKARYEIFDESMHTDALAQLELESDLRHAVENQELMLFYQPVIEIATGQIKSVEALLRWEHPKRGTVHPAEFIPAAEDSGLIIPMGAWILRTACRQAQAWHSSGYDSLKLAVNFSARQFQEPHLIGMIREILDETGFPAHSLIVEITESTAMRDVDKSTEILNELSRWGIHIAIDDFGDGYSSLGYLRRFPIKTLKIARPFLKDLPTDRDNAALTSAMIAMAHRLNLKVVSEGVETIEQLAFLRSLGCEEIQGYICSPALPAEEFGSMLAEKKSWFLDESKRARVAASAAKEWQVV